MIITKEIEIKINPNNINHYKKLGYTNLVNNKNIVVSINHLPLYSKVLIECECDNCNNIITIKYCNYIHSNKNGYYCKDCKSIKIKKTNQLKYGVDNVFQLDSTKRKIKETCLEKYGVEHHLQNKNSIDKLKQTNQLKYGVDFVQKNEKIKLKKENTSINKYGNKTSFLNINVKNKSDKTILTKYGVDNISKSEIIKKKSKLTRISNIKKKYNDLSIIDINSNIYTIKCDNGKENIFNINSTLLYHRKIRYKTIVCTICNEINSKCISGYQTELYNFINENYNGNILINDRNTINGELDIYLPELKLAFEFNGIYWHNELYKDINYHKHKSDLCEEKNIELIHIWEDDWIYKNNIIKSIILDNLNKNIINYDNYIIKEILDIKLIKSFLNHNHIDGYIKSSIKIGLFYQNELLSLMIFNKIKSDRYEILRFCNKLNTNIIDSEIKIFNYFINNFEYNEIISNVDRCYNNSELFKKLGFNLIDILKPDYSYIVNGIKCNKSLYKKSILIKQGYDKNKTEHEIMMEREYYRIYNSGYYKFSYIN